MLNLILMTMNIRYGTAKDGPDAWPHRRQQLFELLNREGADLIGIQEALRFQLDEILAACPAYDAIGAGREDGQDQGEHCAILYRRDRLSVAASGHFWLSETPDVPGSMTERWENPLPRLCTWGRFHERHADREVYHFNTHLDHDSERARVEGIRLILREIAGRSPAAPALLTGDFNDRPDSEAVRLCLDAGLTTLSPTDDGTYHEFTGRHDMGCIDYLFGTPGVQASNARILHDQVAGRYPTDHFPVIAHLAL